MTHIGSTLGIGVRIAIVLGLLACAWYVWVKDPLQSNARTAAQFCKSIAPGMSSVEILRVASARPGVTFSAPEPNVLIVGFGSSHCTLLMNAGVFSGKASTGSDSQE